MLSNQIKNKNLKFLTVIIPVYNVEPYIQRCLDSLMWQCDSSVEILCIDDGSTDDSGKICEKYADKFSNLYVFHKKNGGVASARNLGLQKANGKYIAWVDPDDYVTTNWFKTIKNALQKYEPDCLLFDFYFDTHNSTKEIHTNFTVQLSSKQFIYELSSELNVQSGLPLKVIRKNCFNGLYFDEKAIILEDYKLLTILALRFKKIISIPDCLYYNIKRFGSLTSNVNLEKRLIAAQIAKDRYVLFKKHGFKVSKVSYWKMALLVCLTDYDSDKDNFKELYLQRENYRDELKSDFFKILQSKEVSLNMKLAIVLNIIFPLKFSIALWKLVRNRRYC